MNRWSIQLVLLVSWIVNSTENLHNVTIQHLCEDQFLDIRCAKANETIEIIRSMYGRTSHRLCNANLSKQIPHKTCANIEQSTLQLKHRCHGKSACQLQINNEILNDPCGPSVRKHFEIHYRCRNMDEFCHPLLVNCSLKNDLACVDELREVYSCYCPSTLCEYDEENQIINFIQPSCSSEIVHTIDWPKTLVNKGHHVPCPYPCQGQIFRFCQSNDQWSKPNYTSCRCPLEIHSSRQYLTRDYVFHCRSWLIERFQSIENSCVSTFFDRIESIQADHWSMCLIKAFENMSWTRCSSFSFHFQNLDFEVFLPTSNDRRSALEIQIEIDPTPTSMLLIESNRTSLIFVSKSEQIDGNVTLIFKRRPSDLRHQCRAYRSINPSSTFYNCQTICSNKTHVTCQCPLTHHVMQYVLQVEAPMDKAQRDLWTLENDLDSQCDSLTIDESIKQLEEHLDRIETFSDKELFGQKLLNFVDRRFPPERMLELLGPLDRLAQQLVGNVKKFVFIGKSIEFFLGIFPWETFDQSVRIAVDGIIFPTAFLVFPQLSSNDSTRMNSRLVHLVSKMETNFEIEFRHLNLLNLTSERSICVDWTE